MKAVVVNLTYEIELQPGEKLSLPDSLVEGLGPGRWLIIVQPAPIAQQAEGIRDHSAFLNGYVQEDEGLYDDLPAG